VNLLAFVLALMVHYYLEDRKDPEENWGLSAKTSEEYREEEQPQKHKEQPQPNFYQNTWRKVTRVQRPQFLASAPREIVPQSLPSRS
jgi:hypothetical protein